MTFLSSRFPSIADYGDVYFGEIAGAAASVDQVRLETAAAVLTAAMERGSRVYV